MEIFESKRNDKLRTLSLNSNYHISSYW